MARRISTGIAGKNVLGSIVAVQNSLRSVINNENVVLQASGAGIAASATDFQVNGGNSLRLADGDSSNYVALNAPGTVSANLTFTLPSADGSANQALVTDGSGNLSFSNNFLQIQDRSAADNATYYVAMADSTSGTEDTLSIASDRMSFVPNPGILTVNSISTTNLTATTADINGGTIDGTTLGDNNPAAGTFTSITETSSLAYKTNVAPIFDALNSVKKLNGVTYFRKTNKDVKESGLIAEEVAEVIPEIVTYKNGHPDSISYTKLTAYLIESVKSLSKEIEILKAK